ncbi:MAG: heavy-metal-associated domain-containing protein [Kineosporiaceae bacterium]|nr:heavy-metal-associated domain-containing protein [Aeromicrobium sp.]
MVTFEVQGMTCGHCVRSITKAVHGMDPTARITSDLATDRLQVESTKSDSTKLGDLIRGAGYTPVQVEDGAVSTERQAPRGGCCCS